MLVHGRVQVRIVHVQGHGLDGAKPRQQLQQHDGERVAVRLDRIRDNRTHTAGRESTVSKSAGRKRHEQRFAVSLQRPVLTGAISGVISPSR